MKILLVLLYTNAVPSDIIGNFFHWGLESQGHWIPNTCLNAERCHRRLSLPECTRVIQVQDCLSKFVCIAVDASKANTNKRFCEKIQRCRPYAQNSYDHCEGLMVIKFQVEVDHMIAWKSNHQCWWNDKEKEFVNAVAISAFDCWGCCTGAGITLLQILDVVNQKSKY